jgi:hypothetical protein
MRMTRKAALAATIVGGVASGLGPIGGEPVARAIVQGVETDERLANVGMLAGRFQPGGGWHWLNCSGTLVSPDVFLTAGHCIALGAIPRGVKEFGVTFVPSITFDQASPVRPPLPPGTRVHEGAAFYDPRFNAGALADPAADPFDLAVIRLVRPVEGVRPARIVEVNHFEILRKAYEHRPIALAGYGLTSFLPNLGLAPYDWGVRRVTTGRLAQVFPARIVVGPDPGQICGSDSGGAGFASPVTRLDGRLPRHVAVLSSTVSWSVGLGSPGGTPCDSASILHRLDTPGARAFLGQFVRLSDSGD